MQIKGKVKDIALEAWTEPSGLQKFEVTRISRHLAYEGGKVVRIYPCYSVLSVAEATLGPECGRKD